MESPVPETALPDPLVLIAPAMAIGSRFYRPLVSAFAARGWEARALPRRGFEKGQPPASRSNDWSYRDEIDTIGRAVAAARAEAPGRPVVLLGHSLGAQLVAGHELTHPPADGIVTVAGSLPWFRYYPRLGLHVAAMAALVPVATTLFGHLPKPAFGAPGARTMMREWARMVLTGTPPFPHADPIRTPALVVALEGDELAPTRGIDAFARGMIEPGRATRWDYRAQDAPAGGGVDHVQWVRTPEAVVDRIVGWWHGQAAARATVGATEPGRD
ncbi:alpha/beta fold hydrolase [Nocardia thailandica]